MNDDLEKRIKRAYPNGLLSDLNKDALNSPERDDRIKNVIEKVFDACSLNVWLDPFDKPAYGIAFTQKIHPLFNQWIWQMSNPEKIAWITENNDDPYTVFWLKISRVADYYYYYYNQWVPRGDTGYLDADCSREPSDVWRAHERRICEELDRNGFVYLTDELARAKVPFLLDQDFDAISDDDPRLDDAGVEPPLKPTSLHECLFSN
jgi:hypothetical protein